MSESEPTREIVRKYRSQVPKEHRSSMDTRLQWLWMQRFGTVQRVWQESPDVQDKTAATLILQAVMIPDLNSITLLFDRLEGGASMDTTVLAREEPFKL